MRGANTVVVSGNVGEILHSFTKTSKKAACSFMVASQQSQMSVTWARINVYGINAEKCKERLFKGDYILVEGELMNRRVEQKDSLLEVRGLKITFLTKRDKIQSDDYGTDEKENIEREDV